MSKEKKPKGKTIHPTVDNFECVLPEESVEVIDNEKIYQVSMDARTFKPNEIKIQITPTDIIVKCLHETDEEISEMSEDMKIPEGILPETVVCTMNKNGVLRIFAPYQPKGERDLKSTVISSTVKEVKIVTKEMDSAMEKKILEDKKFVDSTKEIQKKDGKLKMDVDLAKHDDKDIQVSVSKRVVAVQAISSDTSENRPKDVHKKYIIPDGVNPTSFRSFLKSGVLTVLMDEPKTVSKPVPIESKILDDKDKEIEKYEKEAEDISKLMKSESNKFEVKVNTTGYKAEELRMKVTKRVVIVHTHEEIKTKTKRFVKKIIIPAGGTVSEAVTNILNPANDTLTISGPILPEDTSKAEDISTLVSNIGPKKFEVELDVSKFEQKEVEVKVLSNIVTVKAQKQTTTTTEKSEGFFKKFNIPQGVKSQDIQYNFTTKKTLKIFTVETSSSSSTVEKREFKQVSNITPRIVSGGGMSSTSIVTTSSVGEIGKFERKIECPGYKPEEIDVTIANGWITIVGRQQLGPELNFQTRQFTKKFSIPYGIKPEDIGFSLQPNGTLIISNNL